MPDVSVTVAAVNVDVSVQPLNIDVTIAAAGQQGEDGGYASPAETAVVDGTTYAIPAGKKLDSISVVPAIGARVLTVGYSTGTAEVIDNEDVDSNDGASFSIGKYYHTGKTLHFSGFTGSVLVYLL